MKKLLALLATCAVALGTAVAEEYEDISLTDLKEAMKEGKVILLDVNGSEKYNKHHIPGAIDFKANKDQIATLLPENKDTMVVAYCGGPSCGAYRAGVNKAKELGYTDVRHLSLGISGWLAAGEETESGDKKDS